MRPERKTQRSGRERAVWTAGALLIFGIFALWPRSEVWHEGLDRVVPTNPSERHQRDAAIDLNLSDQRFVVWTVSRNARAWVTRPLHLFDAESCYPAEHSLAFSHPLLSLGALGVPAWLWSGDPVVTYNCVLVLVDLLAALAMFLLVTEWTASPAAGVVAALLYAFSPAKIGLGFVTHAMIPDTGWTVLAMLFARRLFAGGGWLTALGLALACAGQLAVSFYPFLASVLVAVPFGAWLVRHYGVRRLRPLPALTCLALIGLAAAGVFAPYLALRGSVISERSTQLFTAWSTLVPGAYISWPCFLLAGAGLLLPRARGLSGIPGDPRWALLAAALLVAWAATGGNVVAQLAAAKSGESVVALPDLYEWLSRWLPGVKSIRIPGHLASGVHLTLSVLAGIGAAALLRMTPAAHRGLVTAALLTAVAVATFHLLPRHQVAEIRPADAELDFFSELAQQGNRGPLFEVPINLEWPGYRVMDTSEQTLLSAYHHRRTSGCYGSYGPPVLEDLERIAATLPSRKGFQELREMGFTTLLVHRDPRVRTRQIYARRIARAAQGHPPPLRPLLENETLAAYEILP